MSHVLAHQLQDAHPYAKVLLTLLAPLTSVRMHDCLMHQHARPRLHACWRPSCSAISLKLASNGRHCVLDCPAVDGILLQLPFGGTQCRSMLRHYLASADGHEQQSMVTKPALRPPCDSLCDESERCRFNKKATASSQRTFRAVLLVRITACAPATYPTLPCRTQARHQIQGTNPVILQVRHRFQ